MILAILQARMSSSRFPGKVLKPLLDKPMMIRQIERIKRSNLIDKIIVATSTDKTDDEIEVVCKNYNIEYFRGSLNDVLDRYYQLAKLYNPDQVVRLTADCPLTDCKLIDEIIEFHVKNDYDYTSNAIKRTYPIGLDVEILKFDILKEIWLKAKLKEEREHLTHYIYNNFELFNTFSYENSEDLSSLRWTVDYFEDYIFIQKVYNILYPVNKSFNTNDIYNLLAKMPELTKTQAVELIGE